MCVMSFPDATFERAMVPGSDTFQMGDDGECE